MSIEAIRKALESRTSADDWRTLESEYGTAIHQHFMPIAEKPNLFTDPIQTPADGSRKWWQFWR